MSKPTYQEVPSVYNRTAASRQHITASALIAAPLADVWRIVRDFGAGELWLPGVTGATLEGGATATQVGAIRELSLSDGASAREQLVGLSDVRHVAEIAILESTLPVSNYVSTWTLTPVVENDHTLMTWAVAFDADPALLQETAEQLNTYIFGPGFGLLRDAVMHATAA